MAEASKTAPCIRAEWPITVPSPYSPFINPRIKSKCPALAAIDLPNDPHTQSTAGPERSQIPMRHAAVSAIAIEDIEYNLCEQGNVRGHREKSAGSGVRCGLRCHTMARTVHQNRAHLLLLDANNVPQATSRKSLFASACTHTRL
jgi:hypothetical protein